MDIQRPSNARAKKIRRIVYGTVALVLVGGVTYGLSKLRPAAPSVDRATIWPDEVKRGPMVRDVRGLGTLVPEDIRWIPAQTDSRVERWVLRPGAVVKPDSIIMELSDPTLQREALDAEFQLKGAEADYANLKVQVDSDLMNQKANEAAVRSDFEQAHLQHVVDEKLFKEGIGSDHIRNISSCSSLTLERFLIWSDPMPSLNSFSSTTCCRWACSKSLRTAASFAFWFIRSLSTCTLRFA